MSTECIKLIRVSRGKDAPIPITSGKIWRITAVGVKGDLSIRIARNGPNSGNSYQSEELLRNDAALAVDVRVDDQCTLMFRNHNMVGGDKWALISFEEFDNVGGP